MATEFTKFTTKDETIKHISNLFANKTHTPDAAGNYHDYPIQSLFTIVHFECGGGLVNGFIDLSVSAKMILTKKNFKIDKSYPSMKLTDGGSNCKHRYSVQINEPKDFTRKLPRLSNPVPIHNRSLRMRWRISKRVYRP